MAEPALPPRVASGSMSAARDGNASSSSQHVDSQQRVHAVELLWRDGDHRPRHVEGPQRVHAEEPMFDSASLAHDAWVARFSAAR